MGRQIKAPEGKPSSPERGELVEGALFAETPSVTKILERYKIAEIIVSSSKIGLDRIEKLKNLCLDRGITIKRFRQGTFRVCSKINW